MPRQRRKAQFLTLIPLGTEKNRQDVHHLEFKEKYRKASLLKGGEPEVFIFQENENPPT